MMKFIASLIIFIHKGILKVLDGILAWCYKQQLISCGKNVEIHPLTSRILGVENMQFSHHVRIHKYATLFSTDAKLIIGHHVAIGPKVTIMTGNHRVDVIGSYIWDVHEKVEGNDKDVVIESEIWAGSNVTILAGAHISRGSIIAAGAVVNKWMPPYAIIGGMPAKVLKYRFTPEQIIEHEKILYPESERLTLEQILEGRQKVKA